MRVVFTCDLHGRKQLFEDMFGYALDQKALCIIIGGDLLPTRLKSPYKILTGGLDFTTSLKTQLDFIDSFLAPLFNSFLKRHPDIRLFYIPGNHDWETSVKQLKRSSPQAVCLHGLTETVDGVIFTGYGCVTDSSFWVKDFVRRDTRESRYIRSRFPLVSTENGIAVSRDGSYALARPSIEEELEGLDLSSPENTVCIFHCPPYGTGIDTLHNGRPIGSRSIAGFIRKNRPLVSLHGHIHEAPYMSGFYHTMIGPTLAINPGFHPRSLHAVVFDTSSPRESLSHRIFGTGAVVSREFDRLKDRYARKIKGFLMKKVLMR